MNKTLKKVIAILLSVMMILSVTSVSFAAEESTEIDHGSTPTMFSMIISFFQEFISLIRYVFYGVWIGEPGPSEIPAAPVAA